MNVQKNMPIEKRIRLKEIHIADLEKIIEAQQNLAHSTTDSKASRAFSECAEGNAIYLEQAKAELVELQKEQQKG